MEIINKSARAYTFGSTVALPDGETVYDIGEGWDLSDEVESGEIEIVKAKKKSGKSKEQEAEPQSAEPELEPVQEPEQPAPEAKK